MNRWQRRAAERKTAKNKKNTFTYEQGVAIAEKAYAEGREVSDTEKTNMFMYAVGLTMKVLHEQWGWGYIRLARLVNQLLEEYNNNNMSLEELQKWCYEFSGINLQIGDKTK